MLNKKHHVVVLTKDLHREDIEQHLINLDNDAKRLRFGVSASDEFIKNYVNHIHNKDKLYGIFDTNIQLIAFAHLAVFHDTHNAIPGGEIGISVSNEYRKLGIGTELFHSVLRNARANKIKIIYSYCLNENDAMKRLARHEHMDIIVEGTDAEGSIRLTDPSLFDIMMEPWYENIAITDYKMKNRFQVLNNMIHLSFVQSENFQKYMRGFY